MLVALTLVVIVVLIVLARRRSTGSPTVQHFTETEENGWYVIDAKPAPGQWQARLMAYGVAGVMAIGTTLVFEPAHTSEGASQLIWLVSTVALSPLTWPLFRRPHWKKRAIQGGPFAVKLGAVRLANGEQVSILDHFSVQRRNTKVPGFGAIAYYVDLDVAGKNYILAGGLSDNQSMAVYNQVNRRINGE